MHITQLPSDRWHDYKTLRLEAITDSPQSFLPTMDEALTQSDEEWQERIKTMFFAVTDDDELVGMTGYYRESKTKQNHIVNVVSVYVSPDYRQQGLARKLLEATIAAIKQNPEIRKIQLGVITTQTAAYDLYQSVGFQKFGTAHRALKVGNTFYDEHLMEMIF